MRCPNCNTLVIVSSSSGRCLLAVGVMLKDVIDEKDECCIERLYKCDNCQGKFKTLERVIEKNITYVIKQS